MGVPFTLDSLGAEFDAALERLSLYLHIPYCTSRCGYCDFNTYLARELGDIGDYLDDLVAEADLLIAALRAQGTAPGPVQTVFIGGGTPTLASGPQLAHLLDRLRERFDISPTAEITIEANPETITDELLVALLASGVNRLSLGMQSGVEHVLATLERVHTPERAVAAVAQAKRCGFTNINLDLIYGTPGESIADWERSIDAVLESDINHVSAYALIVEPGTPLARRIAAGALPNPDDDDLADKYLLADGILSSHGFENYEISNWARPGAECRHNLAYWYSANWFGLGAGAHSHAGRLRWWDHKTPRHWSKLVQAGVLPIAGGEQLSATEHHTERVLLELRTKYGLACDALTETETARLGGLHERGLIELRAGRVHLSRRGRLLADQVSRDLLD